MLALKSDILLAARTLRHVTEQYAAEHGILKRLLGRTALVTGASRGIGAAVTLMMAEEGSNIAVNFRSKGSRAEEIANQVRALGQRALLAQADLTDQGSVDLMARTIERTFGRLDDLVLNASVWRRANPPRMPWNSI